MGLAIIASPSGPGFTSSSIQNEEGVLDSAVRRTSRGISQFQFRLPGAWSISQQPHPKAQHNASTPFGRVPFDVLSQILCDALELEKDHKNCKTKKPGRRCVCSCPPTRYSRLQQLASVSKLWHRTIIHTPQHWSTISSDHHPRLNEMILRRNSNGPLVIRCKNDVVPKQKPEGVSNFLLLASKYVERWRGLHYCQTFWLDEVSTYLSAAPSLEVVRIWTKSQEGFTPTVSLHLDVGLRDMSLMSVSPSPDQYPLIQATSFILDWNESFPSLPQLLEILAASPGLETLYLRPLLPPPEDTAHTTTSLAKQVISLPSAETISLRHLPNSYLVPLLTHLRAPACDTLEITHEVPSDLFSNKPFRELLATPLRKANYVLLVYWTITGMFELFAFKDPRQDDPWVPYLDFDWDTEILRSCDAVRVYLRTFLTDPQHWKHIASFLEEIAPLPIHLEFNSGSNGDGRIGPDERPVPRFDLLHSTPRVEALRTVGFNEANYVLRHISIPYTAPSGELRWRFPDLKVFKFKKTFPVKRESFLSLLGVCMRMRSGAALSMADVPGTVKLPRPLERVIVSRKNRNALRKNHVFDGIDVTYKGYWTIPTNMSGL